MKRTITALGYYHPRNANWSYKIVLLIDKTGARLYRSVFGGDTRTERKYNMKELYAGQGSDVQYKWRDVKDLLDVEKYTGKNY